RLAQAEVRDAPDGAGLDQLLGLARRPGRPQLVVHDQHDAGRAACRDHLVGEGEVERDGLLDQDVHAGLGGRERRGVVHGRGRGGAGGVGGGGRGGGAACGGGGGRGGGGGGGGRRRAGAGGGGAARGGAAGRRGRARGAGAGRGRARGGGRGHGRDGGCARVGG